VTQKFAWPYVTLKVRGTDGALVLREFYKDAPVPAGADADDLARLVRKGAVVDEDVVVSDTPPFDEVPAEPEAKADEPKKAVAKKTAA
jgi:hypothetical protein